MDSDNRDGLFTVYPGDVPTRFVDIVRGQSPTSGPNSDWIDIRYADRNLPSILPASSRRFTLRVDGGGLPFGRTFVVEKTLSTGRLLVMREAEE